MDDVLLRDDVVICYENDYFGPPWVDPPVALLVHGIAESSRAWTQWIPVLAARLRVIRPDLPGFGKSPVPATYDWTPEQCASDLVRLLDKLGIDHIHLVGAKYGGTIAMQLAGEFPDRVASLSIFGSPATGLVTDAAERVQASSVRKWAEETQRARLGHAAPEAQIRWWTDELMGYSDPRAVIGSNHAIRESNVTAWLGHISAPSLIVTTENSGLQSVEAARRYQVLIPNSRLEVMAGDHYHAAAVEPERCAHMVFELIEDSQSR